MTTEDIAGLASEALETITDMETKYSPVLETRLSQEEPNIDQEGKFMNRI
jgi:hypothetical protein